MKFSKEGEVREGYRGSMVLCTIYQKIPYVKRKIGKLNNIQLPYFHSIGISVLFFLLGGGNRTAQVWPDDLEEGWDFLRQSLESTNID